MKICIDPGHGGSDPGAVNKKTKLTEKSINLLIAKELKEQLELTKLKDGGFIKVILTRSKDEEVYLNKRTYIANKEKADLFISIHCNAAGNINAQGIETFIFPGSLVSGDIASKIHKSIINEFPDHINRRIKEANYHVLRETSMPAILIECEFISNDNQANFLNNPLTHQRYAKSIAKGVLQWIN